MARIRLLGYFIIALLAVLLSYGTLKPNKVQAMIVPHHLFVEGFIDKLYESVADSNRYRRIILVSPNHFGYGFSWVQSDRALKGASERGRYLEKEHGLTIHHPFIDRYFSSAEIIPIIIKQGAPLKVLTDLIEGLNEMDLSRTLIIASIDFSHSVSEETALKNDERILSWLDRWNKEGVIGTYKEIKDLGVTIDEPGEGNVAMDSPETFYILIKTLEQIGKKDFKLWKRTSSASLSGTGLVDMNVSHIFATF